MPAQTLRDRYLSEAVATASPAALVVMLYDRLALDLSRAVEALKEPVDLEGAHNALVHAQDVVMGLRASLRVDEWADAPKLMAVYEWLSSQLLQANMRKDPAIVAHCHEIVAPLQQAWRQASGGDGAAADGLV